MSMSRITLRVVVIALALIGPYGQNVFGKVLVVGNCLGGTKYYSTIQSAVNATASGDTVEVCPGTYPEQVSITNPGVTGITVKGIASGNRKAAVITVPTTGLLENGLYSATPVPAQVYVTSVGVLLSDLIVDGTGAACFAVPTIGVLFHEVVSADLNADGGTVQHLVVRNEDACGPAGQPLAGQAIVSDGSFITIDANVINNVDAYGIVGNGGKVQITSNILSNNLGSGPLTGISLDPQATGARVTGNQIIGSPVGITGISLDPQATGARVTGNQIFGSPVGISILNDNGDVIENNVVSSSEFGIIVNSSDNEVITSNKIANSSQAALWLVNSDGNNSFQNEINEAPVGLLGFASAAPTDTFSNTYFNVQIIKE